MKKIKAPLIITLIILILMSVSLIQSAAVWDDLLVPDNSHDVMHIVNGQYSDQGEFRGEIDIVQLQVTNTTVVLTLDEAPETSGRTHLYEIFIYWNSDHNFGFTSSSVNYTHCILGLKDGILYDIVRMNTVTNNASGVQNFSEEYENITSTTLTKVTWDITSQYNDFEKNPSEIVSIYAFTKCYIPTNDALEYWIDWLPDTANTFSTTAAAALICLCPFTGIIAVIAIKKRISK